MAKNTQNKRRIIGTKEKPRVSVFRSNRFISVQLINDSDKHTLASASSLGMKNGQNNEAARAVGKSIAEKVQKLSISNIVFDRGRYRYVGRVKTLAESIRENGIDF